MEPKSLRISESYLPNNGLQKITSLIQSKGQSKSMAGTPYAVDRAKSPSDISSKPKVTQMMNFDGDQSSEFDEPMKNMNSQQSELSSLEQISEIDHPAQIEDLAALVAHNAIEATRERQKALEVRINRLELIYQQKVQELKTWQKREENARNQLVQYKNDDQSMEDNENKFESLNVEIEKLKEIFEKYNAHKISSSVSDHKLSSLKHKIRMMEIKRDLLLKRIENLEIDESEMFIRISPPNAEQIKEKFNKLSHVSSSNKHIESIIEKNRSLRNELDKLQKQGPEAFNINDLLDRIDSLRKENEKMKLESEMGEILTESQALQDTKKRNRDLMQELKRIKEGIKDSQ